ncbi:MAG: hypothetical protein ACLFQS_10580 [Bacteroidales bacterium]
MTSIPSELVNYNHTRSNLLRWFLVIVLIYALLVAVGIIGDGFKLATGGHAAQLFNFATNPVVALIIGIVATASIQSSSTVTSIIVGLVAGGMPLSIAIPMIMGANVGTSLTSTIVSLGHIRNGDEFQRAFSAATVHDSFNLLAVVILLPVELLFSPLENVSGFFASLLRPGATTDVPGFNPLGLIIKPAVDTFFLIAGYIPGIWGGIFMIFAGILLILFVVNAVGKVLKVIMVGRALEIMHRTIGRGPVSGITTGSIITILVQSSSTTTSLIVPMAGSGIFTLRQVYPFTLGGNLGTTITALLAAASVTGPLAVFALQIALVHLFFNLFAIIFIYSIPFLRDIPVFVAEKLAVLAQRKKAYVFAYIFGVFFVGPLSVIALSRLFGM